MKRILSLILTLCVMLSCVSISPVVYAENNSEKWKIGENYRITDQVWAQRRIDKPMQCRSC